MTAPGLKPGATSMNFLQQKTTHGRARRGQLETAHGVIQTPFFMPIATKGAVKTMSSRDMKNLGAQILLSNTYHLLLRPGLEAMRELGGLHRFMNWDGPILTDSGGYQVFSLSKMNKTTEEGVTFQSHIDGARVNLTPELSMQMQAAIGSDIVMQFDDVAAGDSSRERYEEAMERSLRWAGRCKAEYSSLRAPAKQSSKIASSPLDELGAPRNDETALFAIVQGARMRTFARNPPEVSWRLALMDMRLVDCRLARNGRMRTES